MSFEIEIKAWVDNFDSIKVKLDNKYKYIKDYYKEDIYFSGTDASTNKEKEIRLRRVGDNSIVTFKDRSHRGKVEVNIEKEFTVDNPENFKYIINELGYKPYIEKSKKGYLYLSGNINIELSHVKNLGDFIEIEAIRENEREVEEATLQIHKILDNIDIPRNKIEDRFYVEMLRNKINGSK